MATPLDVVKVRLQAAAPGGGAHAQLQRAVPAGTSSILCGILERIMCSMHRRNILSPFSIFSPVPRPAASSASVSRGPHQPLSEAPDQVRHLHHHATHVLPLWPSQHTRGGGGLSDAHHTITIRRATAAIRNQNLFTGARQVQSAHAGPNHAVNSATSIPTRSRAIWVRSRPCAPLFRL